MPLEDIVHEITLIGEAGGMRNAFASGLKNGFIQKGLHPDMISRAYGCSSAVPQLAYFLTGDCAQTRRIWLRLTDRALLNPRRVFSAKHVGDIDRLVDHHCATLKISKLDEVCLFAVLAHHKSAEPHYLRVTSTNAREVLKAGCVVPALGRPIYVSGERYIDGGVLDPLPVIHAYEEGARRIIVISNRPAGYAPRGAIRELILPWLLFCNHPKLLARFSRLWEHYNQTIEFMKRPPADLDLLVIRPDHPLPPMLTRNPRLVRQAYNAGRQIANREWPRVEQFLSPKKSPA